MRLTWSGSAWEAYALADIDNITFVTYTNNALISVQDTVHLCTQNRCKPIAVIWIYGCQITPYYQVVHLVDVDVMPLQRATIRQLKHVQLSSCTTSDVHHKPTFLPRATQRRSTSSTMCDCLRLAYMLARSWNSLAPGSQFCDIISVSKNCNNHKQVCIFHAFAQRSHAIAPKYSFLRMLAKWQVFLLYKHVMLWTNGFALVVTMVLSCRNLTTCMKAHCNNMPGFDSKTERTSASSHQLFLW